MNTQNVTQMFHDGRMPIELVNAQMNRFNSFIESTNLLKIGKAYVHFTLHADGQYNQYNYISKVLGRAGVHRSMICPGTNHFYGDILQSKAMTVFFDSLKK